MSIVFSVYKSPDLESLWLRYPDLTSLRHALNLDKEGFFNRLRVSENNSEHGALSWKDATELAPKVLSCAIDAKTWEPFSEDSRDEWQRLGIQLATLLEKASERGRRLMVEF